MKYRPDIDGLRAIAVVSVVLYHAGFTQFPGGFAGVDIFFVISGYLITGILLQDLREQRFSITAFYGRRARRILPALFVVLSVSSLAAYKLFLPPDMSHFGGSLLAVLFLSSNVLFSQTTDYFAPAAEMTPLLHMWSLSVEEQFYIIFPLFLAILLRRIPKHYGYLLGALLMLSLGWNIHDLLKPHETFYSTMARAWELLLGGLLAGKVLPKIGHRISVNLLGLTGVCFIVGALLLPAPNSSSYFFVTVGVCFGTALVIYSAELKSTIVSTILALPPFVFIGLVSYSLYLWHWVFLVFARHYSLHALTTNETVKIIAASFMMAIVSWAGVEIPFRKIRSGLFRSYCLGLTLVFVCVLAGFGILLQSTNGLPSRFTGSLELIVAGAKDIWGRWVECQYKVCRIGPDNTRESFMLWGDSHGGSIAPALERIANLHHIAGYVAFNPSCPPVIGLDNFDLAGHPCPPLADSVMSFIKSHHLKMVLLHASWAAYVKESPGNRAKLTTGSGTEYETRLKLYEKQVRETLRELKTLDVRVIVVMSVPGAKMNVPTALARAFSVTGSPDIRDIMYSYAEFLRRESTAFGVLRRLAKEYSVEMVFPHDTLCDGEICLAADGLVPFYTDDQHLTVHAAQFLLPMFEKLFTPVSQNPGSQSY